MNLSEFIFTRPNYYYIRSKTRTYGENISFQPLGSSSSFLPFQPVGNDSSSFPLQFNRDDVHQPHALFCQYVLHTDRKGSFIGKVRRNVHGLLHTVQRAQDLHVDAVGGHDTQQADQIRCYYAMSKILPHRPGNNLARRGPKHHQKAALPKVGQLNLRDYS